MLYNLLILLVVIFIFQHAIGILVLKVEHKRKRRIREALRKSHAHVLKMEFEIIDGALDDSPMLKERFEHFIKFHDGYTSGGFGLVKMNLIKILTLKVDVSKNKDEIISLSKELELQSDEVKELFKYQAFAITTILRTSSPILYESGLSIYLIKLVIDTVKKNKTRRKLPNFRRINFKEKREAIDGSMVFSSTQLI